MEMLESYCALCIIAIENDGNVLRSPTTKTVYRCGLICCTHYILLLKHSWYVLNTRLEIA